MKKNAENGVGEPGQFKTTRVVGFTPIDHTPSEPSATKKGRTSKQSQGKTQSAEKEQATRVKRHHMKGVSK